MFDDGRPSRKLGINQVLVVCVRLVLDVGDDLLAVGSLVFRLRAQAVLVTSSSCRADDSDIAQPVGEREEELEGEQADQTRVTSALVAVDVLNEVVGSPENDDERELGAGQPSVGLALGLTMATAMTACRP